MIQLLECALHVQLILHTENNMATIELMFDIDGKLRLVVEGVRVYNDQSLSLSSILQMVKNQKITEDLIFELEDIL